MEGATVRAKFRVSKVDPRTDSQGGNVTLEAVTSGSVENDQFFKWTPSGRIDMGTVNQSAFAQFHEGDEVYVDFTPAPKK
jgi:hypothetical protein